MLRQAKGARRYNERITLTLAGAVRDDFGHASFAEPVDVLEVFAYVRQMSASKTMMTFQQADAVGLEIELRNPHVAFNGIRYRGHDVHFAQPEDVDGRGRILRISGWYQTDNPTMV
jgi:head-tail adaptor